MVALRDGNHHVPNKNISVGGLLRMQAEPGLVITASLFTFLGGAHMLQHPQFLTHLETDPRFVDRGNLILSKPLTRKRWLWRQACSLAL